MKNYLITAILLLAVYRATAQDWALELSSTVELRSLKLTNVAEKYDRGLGGATIALYQGSTVVKQVYSDANGDFVISIPPNGDYVLMVSYQDCNAKKFQISTKGVPADYTKDNFKPRFSIGGAIMARPLHGIDYSVLNQPLAKILFMSNGKKFDDDNNYTQQILSSLEKIGDAEDALIEKFISYTKAGDAALKKNDCPAAKSNYENALATISGEQYPKEQLVKVGLCLKDRENAGKRSEDDAAAKAAAEKAAADKLLADKAAREKANAEKIAADQLAREKAEAEKANAEKLAQDKEAAGRLNREKTEANKAAKEKAAADKIAGDKAMADKLAKETAEAEKAAAGKAAAEKLAMEKVEADKANAARLAKEKAAADKKAKEKAEADKALADKVAADKANENKLAKEKAAAEKAEAARLAKQMAEAEKLARQKEKEAAAAKAEADRVAKEKEAGEKQAAPKPATEKEAPIVAKETPAADNTEDAGGKKGNAKYSIPTKLGGKTYRDVITKADGYYKMKRYAEAKVEYEEALKLKADDVYATNKLADIERLTAPKQP